MAVFNLKIFTLDKEFFNGDVDKLVVRTTEGDVGILKNHEDYISCLDIGEARIYLNSEIKRVAISGGFIKVYGDKTVILSNSCEWADQIDIERSYRSEKNAKSILNDKQDKSDIELNMAELALKRAINRINVYKNKN